MNKACFYNHPCIRSVVDIDWSNFPNLRLSVNHCLRLNIVTRLIPFQPTEFVFSTIGFLSFQAGHMFLLIPINNISNINLLNNLRLLSHPLSKSFQYFYNNIKSGLSLKPLYLTIHFLKPTPVNRPLYSRHKALIIYILS